MITIINEKDVKKSKWSGGTTSEYIVYPNGTTYANKDFTFRISSATIEQDESTFTKFEGYTRYLVMLNSELKVNVNGDDKKFEKYEVFKFNSNDNVISFAKGMDFNLMVNAKKHNCYVANSASIVASIVVIYTLSKTNIKINGVSFDVAERSLIMIDEENIELMADANVIIGEVYL